MSIFSFCITYVIALSLIHEFLRRLASLLPMSRPRLSAIRSNYSANIFFSQMAAEYAAIVGSLF